MPVQFAVHSEVVPRCAVAVAVIVEPWPVTIARVVFIWVVSRTTGMAVSITIVIVPRAVMWRLAREFVGTRLEDTPVRSYC